MLPLQSGPGSDGNERVLCILQISSISGNSPLDCLVSYPGQSFSRGSYPSTEVQSVYSTAPADWARLHTFGVVGCALWHMNPCRLFKAIIIFIICEHFFLVNFIFLNVPGLIYLHRDDSKDRKWLNVSIWLIDGNLTCTITPGQSWPGSNSNEVLLYIPQTSRMEPQHQMQFKVIPRTLNGFKYCYLTLITLVNIIHSFAHS